jgi:DNA-binding IclR family transcriptional regulator
MRGERPRKAGVQSVDRAIGVLEFLARTGWAGVTEVANALDIHKSTAHRLLATLLDHGLVDQDAHTDRYRLGLGLVSLASTVTADLDVLQYARPVGERLGEETRETVTVSVLIGDEVMVIHQSMPSASVLSVDWRGKHLPLHCTSDGKVLLAHLPETRQRAILTKPLARFTEHTIVKPGELRAQLETIRTAGYGYTLEELELGLNAVAAPVYLGTGTVAATIGVSGPAFRLAEQSIPAMGALTRSAAAEVSRRLGFTAALARDQE